MEKAMYLVRRLVSGLFSLLRRRGVRHRVCFFSRQSSRPSADYRLLQDELRQMDPSVEIVTLCYRYRDRRDGTLPFLWCCLRSIFLMSRAEVCVLDGYWPTVCMLRDKKDLRVIQIWHSLGKIKQSGYQTLDRASGRRSDLARAMCMHRNYDTIIAGGEAWDAYYCAAFDVERSRLRNWGLPRLDRLAAVDGESVRALREKYPELAGRTVVLYAPTYRKYPLEVPETFFSSFPPEKYALICRYHPNQCFTGVEERSDYPQEDIFRLLQLCDYFITDYSSLALEAAAMNKPTIYYLPDDERYRRENGVNIDLHEIMPDCTFSRGEDVFALIDGRSYPAEELQSYRRRYLPDRLGHATEQIASLILDRAG